MEVTAMEPATPKKARQTLVWGFELGRWTLQNDIPIFVGTRSS